MLDDRFFNCTRAIYRRSGQLAGFKTSFVEQTSVYTCDLVSETGEAVFEQKIQNKELKKIFLTLVGCLPITPCSFVVHSEN